MFKIGDFSKLTFVSIRMLRYYDEMGLFKPAEVDDFTGYRYYTANQIKPLNLIVSLRDLGFKVADIALVLEESSEEKQKEMLVNKKTEVEMNILLENKILKKIDSALENLNKEKVNMSYNVKIKTIPSYKVLSVRDVIPTYSDEGILWDRICRIMEEKKISAEKVCYAKYHDEGFKESDVDVEVVMEVKELLKDGKGYTFKETEPVKEAASILVPGEFSNIAPAFAYLAKWIEENGYTICGCSRQLTMKGPWNESDPDNYLCEIQMPVTK